MAVGGPGVRRVPPAQVNVGAGYRVRFPAALKTGFEITGGRIVSDLQEKEADLEKHIQEGDTEAAVACLYELIVAHAKRKNFAKAEALRDRLYEVDPMALSEIVKSGEILEQEKSESRDEGHMDTWSKLYTSLLTEEANAFYYALSTASFEPDQTLFEEGDRNRRLYLINQGEIKITHGKGEREVLLKMLGPGDMVGGETFFSRTAFCTYSAATLSPVRASMLEPSALETWKEEFPGLEAKINEYCFRTGNIQDILNSRNMDRRARKRVSLSGTLVLQLLKKDGTPMGKPFKGGFSDISDGGLAFLLRVSKPETARLLLGRRLAATCRLPMKGGPKDIRVRGRIIAIQPRLFNEYSAHVRFEKGLAQGFVDGLDTTSKAQGPDLELKIEEGS